MATLFISDLHLDAARPEVTAAFLRFLQGLARQADDLYILGDLFDAWIGDDATDTHQRRIVEALRDYTSAGHRCYFLHGNRDFLIGAGFAEASGVEVLPGPQIIDLDGETALILHGDELCTDDRDYQRLRCIVRHRVLQWSFLQLPAGLRQRIARRLRAGSSASQDRKAPEIMDVNQAAVTATMRRHGVSLMIHGHTHRPAIHELRTPRGRRIVLGDWYSQGSVLYWTAAGPELRRLSYS